MKKIQTIAAVYFLIQGLATIGWWTLLVLDPSTSQFFLPSGVPPIALLGFWLADAVFFAFGSIVCGLVLLLRSNVSINFFWLVAGGISYAALYCVGLSLIANGGWMSSLLMVAAMVTTLYFVYQLNRT